MRITNGKIYTKGHFIDGYLDFNEKIEDVGQWPSSKGKKVHDEIDVSGGYVIPGLIDIHTHGALGEDVSDGKEAALKKLV